MVSKEYSLGVLSTLNFRSSNKYSLIVVLIYFIYYILIKGTIIIKLLKSFDEYLEEIDFNKRSKYIENLIREDMKKRGKDVSIDF